MTRLGDARLARHVDKSKDGPKERTNKESSMQHESVASQIYKAEERDSTQQQQKRQRKAHEVTSG